MVLHRSLHLQGNSKMQFLFQVSLFLVKHCVTVGSAWSKLLDGKQQFKEDRGICCIFWLKRLLQMHVNTEEVFGYICEMLICIKFTTASTSSDTIGQDVNDYCDLMRS